MMEGDFEKKYEELRGAVEVFFDSNMFWVEGGYSWMWIDGITMEKHTPKWATKVIRGILPEPDDGR